MALRVAHGRRAAVGEPRRDIGGRRDVARSRPLPDNAWVFATRVFTPTAVLAASFTVTRSR